MVPLSYLLKLNLFPEKDVQPQNIKLSQSLAQFTTTIHRGYYTVARRYEFYVRVARTISHE